MSESARPRPFQLLDLTALVVGYGLASLLIRAFWPSGEPPTLAESVVIGGFYTWLGLAMSGPFVLLVHRPAEPVTVNINPTPGRAHRKAPPAMIRPYTGAELAWLMIGFYWIGMTVLVVALRGDRSTLQSPALIGLFPIVGVIGVLLGLFRAARRTEPEPALRERDEERQNRLTGAWTHRAAVGLLLTWPIAWMALILLGKTML
jgi:hypothetical protein